MVSTRGFESHRCRTAQDRRGIVHSLDAWCAFSKHGPWRAHVSREWISHGYRCERVPHRFGVSCGEVCDVQRPGAGELWCGDSASALGVREGSNATPQAIQPRVGVPRVCACARRAKGAVTTCRNEGASSLPRLKHFGPGCE